MTMEDRLLPELFSPLCIPALWTLYWQVKHSLLSDLNMSGLRPNVHLCCAMSRKVQGSADCVTRHYITISVFSQPFATEL